MRYGWKLAGLAAAIGAVVLALMALWPASSSPPASAGPAVDLTGDWVFNYTIGSAFFGQCTVELAQDGFGDLTSPTNMECVDSSGLVSGTNGSVAGTVSGLTATSTVAFTGPGLPFSTNSVGLVDATGSHASGTWGYKPGGPLPENTFVGERLPSGALITVNDVGDVVDDSPGDGACETVTPGVCTLRAAIQEANALAGDDAILLLPGTYEVAISGTGEDAAATGDLDITSNISIIGSNAKETEINGGDLDRVFHVHSGATALLTDVTITGGTTASGEAAAGVFFDVGGGTLRRTAVDSNIATAGNGGGVGSLGAAVSIESSTISNNTAELSAGGIGIDAGTTTIVNSTISNNHADENAGGIGQQTAGATLTMNNSTVAFNRADADLNLTGVGGGLAHDSLGTVTLQNTLVALNEEQSPTFAAFAPDCVGTISSGGYNLIANASSCSFSAMTGDQVGTGSVPVDSMIGASLEENGGPTLTHSVPVVSPAVDRGNPATVGSGSGACESLDQRGDSRPIDGDSNTASQCDIGAYEATGVTTPACPVTDNPLPLGGCNQYKITANNVVVVGIADPCTVKAHAGATRSAVATSGLDNVTFDITFFSGYIDCPGELLLGVSALNIGTIEEVEDNANGTLEFPATGKFKVCLVADTYPFGVLTNCPPGEPPDQLELTCTLANLEVFECTISATTFYDESGTPYQLQGGQAFFIDAAQAVGGEAELPLPSRRMVAASEGTSASTFRRVTALFAAAGLAAVAGGAWALGARRGAAKP